MRITIAITLLLFGTLAPFTASAQEMVPAPANRVETEFVPIETEPIEYPSTATRVAAELGIGVLLMGLSAGSGALLVGRFDDGGALGASITAFLGGFPMTAAVWGVGSALGGNGGAGWTLLGTMLGGLTSAPLVLLTLFSNDDEIVALGYAAFALPAIGAVLGYELSHDDDERPQTGPTLSIAPMQDGSGGFASLAGTW